MVCYYFYTTYSTSCCIALFQCYFFKIANPNSVLRFCGGRMRLSDENQRKALNSCVEGIMIGNYLTTIGKAPEEDIKTINEMGKVIKSK